MIVRVINGKDVAGAVRYNERKVAHGEAEILAIENYPSFRIALQSVRNRIEPLELLTAKNARVSQPALHFVLAFHPQDTLSDDKLKDISGNFMKRMGYGEQPYVVYRHDDTNHPHLHLVTVAIDRNGKKISDSFIKQRCNKNRQELEVKYGLIQAEGRDETSLVPILPSEIISYGKQPLKTAIGGVVRMAMKEYSISSFDQFNQFLHSYNISMLLNSGVSQGEARSLGVSFQFTDGIKSVSPSIKASRFSFKPTWTALQKQFTKAAALKKKLIPQFESTLKKVLSAIPRNETMFRDQLRSQGILLREEGERYLFIDQKGKAVYSESELSPSFARQQLLQQFDRTQTTDIGKEPDKLHPDSLTNAQLLDASIKKLIRQTSQQYQQLRRESQHYFESEFIRNFPHVALVERLTKEGVERSGAIQSSRRFEEYKRGQLPEILAKEQAYFDQTTKAYVQLVRRMPINAHSREIFLNAVNLKLVTTPEGTHQLEHTHHRELTYPLSTPEFNRLVQTEYKTSITFPTPLAKAERSTYLAISLGEAVSLGGLPEEALFRLRQCLPGEELERIPSLNPVLRTQPKVVTSQPYPSRSTTGEQVYKPVEKHNPLSQPTQITPRSKSKKPNQGLSLE